MLPFARDIMSKRHQHYCCMPGPDYVLVVASQRREPSNVVTEFDWNNINEQILAIWSLVEDVDSKSAITCLALPVVKTDDNVRMDGISCVFNVPKCNKTPNRNVRPPRR